MMLHYFNTTLKYLRANKVFAIINLTGLAMAFTVLFFAFKYVKFELSFDKFHENVDHIYRVSTDVHSATGVNKETSAAGLSDEILHNFPEVKTTARVFLDYYIVQKDENSFGEELLAYADPSVFSIFSFPLLRGNPEVVFRAPYDMVLSETAAMKYFGTIDCLGKKLTLDGSIPATVTGVMKDIPLNSHIRTDIFLSMSSLIKPETNWINNWKRFGFSTYVQLNEHVNVEAWKHKLSLLANAHPLGDGLTYSLVAEPLSELYLKGSFRNNKAGATLVGNDQNVYIFSLVAIIVLCIACFNFINLTTAFSIKRTKELGVRKVLGASRRQLAFQFFSDAIVLSVVAFFVALVFSFLLAPYVNNMAGKTIVSDPFEDLWYLFAFLGVSVCAGLAAAIYPALSLSVFNPVNGVKGNNIIGINRVVSRKALVIAQFVISIALIVSVIVVREQLKFMKNEKSGFTELDHLVIDFHYDNRILSHREKVISELTSIPGVDQASFASAIPGRANKKFPTVLQDAQNMPVSYQSDAYFIDDQFLSQYGLQMIAGRSFSKDFLGDPKTNMIVNETAVRKAGYQNPMDILGKKFEQRGTSGTITGVVKDFHFHSKHEEIQPLTLQYAPGFFTFLTLTLESKNVGKTIAELEQKWALLAPGLPMIYFFAEDAVNNQYLAEERFGKLFTAFAILAIFISCLGLLGLASFTTLQRTKEIGIRKVLGASVPEIAKLLTGEFVILVMIAFLLAVPISWWAMKSWLENFAYRISLHWIYFVLSGIMALIVAFITVCIIALQAAKANPIKSIRTSN